MITFDINSLRTHFNEQLDQLLSNLHSASPKLIEAMTYSSMAKSKRLRPLLVYATGQLLNIPVEELDPIAVAIELIHTYSLIHDDLPAMDDDDIRRGVPSCHKQFDEATAILAGDALQGLAIEHILTNPILTTEQKNRISLKVVQASSYQGMIAGQSLDLDLLSSSELTLQDLQQIHLMKTACLIDCCIKTPQVLVDQIDMITKKQLAQLGSVLGLTFQIQDDYLDRYGLTQALGKPQGADQARNIKTFADFYDKQALEELIAQHYLNAKQLIANLNAPLMLEIIDQLESRNH